MIQGCENPLAEPGTARGRRGSPIASPTRPAHWPNPARWRCSVSAPAAAPARATRAGLRVALESRSTPPPRWRCWQVDAAGAPSGSEDACAGRRGGGWLFASIELDERDHGGPGSHGQAGLRAAAPLRRRRSAQPRAADLELPRRDQPAAKATPSATSISATAAPPAWAISSPTVFPPPRRSAISATHTGCRSICWPATRPAARVENPRQVSAWRYPRQYGRTPPSFARAMMLPAQDALAISGTAAVVGHASAHHDDLRGPAATKPWPTSMPCWPAPAWRAGFDTHSPLKAYVRHAADGARCATSSTSVCPACRCCCCTATSAAANCWWKSTAGATPEGQAASGRDESGRRRLSRRRSALLTSAWSAASSRPGSAGGCAPPSARRAGASLVITEPAPMVASAPTVTGATRALLEPMKAPSPIRVRCLFTPS